MNAATERSSLPALPIPANLERVHAFADQGVMDRWGRDCAGLHAIERGDNVITMFGAIGEDPWSDGPSITAKNVSKQLRAIGGPVEVQINSPGGDVFEGFAIYNLLREHPYPVAVKIIGMAASAASVVAMAGDQIEIGSAAFLMIHNCWLMAVGNRHDFRELADWLEPFDNALAQVYVQRSGSSEREVKKWLDDETYMSGAVAVDRGFADDLLPSDQVALDEERQASDRAINDVRAIEQSLLASGLTRTQARARIQRVKGAKSCAGSLTPTGEGKPDAADWISHAGPLLANLQQPLLNKGN